jgi:hypothetical protein
MPPKHTTAANAHAMARDTHRLVERSRTELRIMFTSLYFTPVWPATTLQERIFRVAPGSFVLIIALQAQSDHTPRLHSRTHHDGSSMRLNTATTRGYRAKSGDHLPLVWVASSAAAGVVRRFGGPASVRSPDRRAASSHQMTEYRVTVTGSSVARNSQQGQRMIEPAQFECFRRKLCPLAWRSYPILI